MAERTGPHPFVWTVLYLPFGALGGFVTVALTFLARGGSSDLLAGAGRAPAARMWRERRGWSSRVLRELAAVFRNNQ